MRIVLVLAVLAAALAVPAAAQACSLAAMSPEMRVAAVDGAVFGKVVARELVAEPRPGQLDVLYRYRVRVLRRYKGPRTVRRGRTVELLGSSNDAMCGVGLFEVGARQGFLLRGRRGPWQVSLASRISRAELEQVAPARRRRG